MALNLRSFTTLVAMGKTAAQSSYASLSLNTGTALLSLIEASAGIALWLQNLATNIILTTRLSTSSGNDCDTFVNDYGMTRLPGASATGMVTLTSFTPVQSSAVVLPGAVVRTVSGVNYVVVQDATQAAWSSSTGGYVRPSGTVSISVPVQAQQAGSSGNVAAGAICLLGTAISGIDTVTNPSPLTNGSDQETDAQLKARFPLWLSAKATASKQSIENAISSIQNGITYELIDCKAPDGSARLGYFTAVINDGSGNPPDSLLAQVYNSINSAKALGIQFSVQRPLESVINVSMTVFAPAGTNSSSVISSIQNAIASDINAQQVGSGYPYSRVSYLAYTNAGTTINSINSVLINGAQSDIPAQDKTIIVAGNITVNVVMQ